MADKSLIFLLQDTNASIDLILNKLRESNCDPINKQRTTYGEYHHLFQILKKYETKFKQYTRMKISTFNYILSHVEKFLQKNWCNLHTQPIEAEERLVVTIRFLATGMSYTELSFAFRMGISTVSCIVRETMEILWKILSPLHMPVPTEQQFVTIAEEFYENWQLPNCLGAIDGRHVRIRCPSKSGSLYFNYKKFFSIVLQAVVDANCKYIIIDVGGYGRQSDGGTLKASSFYQCLKKNLLKIPQVRCLPGSEIELPHFFIGDGAYPLMESLMRPYPGLNLLPEQKRFNKRLSRARMVVERAFGMTCQKWRIFYTTIQQSPEVVNIIVKSTCILHNVILDQESDENMTGILNTENILVSDTHEGKNNFSVESGKEIRNELTKYFMLDN